MNAKPAPFAAQKKRTPTKRKPLPWLLTEKEWQRFSRDPEAFRGKVTYYLQDAVIPTKIYSWEEMVEWAKTSPPTPQPQRVRDGPRTEEFCAKSLRHWQAALEAHRREIELEGLTLANRLTLARLEHLVQRSQDHEQSDDVRHYPLQLLQKTT